MYCIYSGTDIDEHSSNDEHIFPLSLGGRNDFTTRVSITANSRVNREIDEKLSRCFFLARDRKINNAQGHRGSEISPKNTKISVGDDTSVIFKFDEHNFLQLYSHKKQRFITEEEIKINGCNIKITIQRSLRAKFSAKVALAAGYFIYGDTFKNNVEISELRHIMNYMGEEYDEAAFDNLMIKGWFWPEPPLEKDLIEHEIYKRMAEHIGCSFVAIVTRANPDYILVIVGILGNLAGIIRCPAHCDSFPYDGEYDLGHAVILEKSFLRRVSYRTLLNEINFSLLLSGSNG